MRGDFSPVVAGACSSIFLGESGFFWSKKKCLRLEYILCMVLFSMKPIQE